MAAGPMSKVIRAIHETAKREFAQYTEPVLQKITEFALQKKQQENQEK